MLPLEAPLNNNKWHRANGASDDQNGQLDVEAEVRGIEEADGRRHGLCELEEGECANRIVDELAAQHGIDLRIEAGIAKTQ